MTAASSDKKTRIDEACKTAEEFVDIFYDKMDSKRQTIGKMYLETATLAWNGNKMHTIDKYRMHLAVIF